MLRRRDLNGAFLRRVSGAASVVLPAVQLPDEKPVTVTVEGPEARALLGRTLVLRNRIGADEKGFKAALDVLQHTGGSEQMIDWVAGHQGGLGFRLPHMRQNVESFSIVKDAPLHGPQGFALSPAAMKHPSGAATAAGSSR